MTDLSPIDFSIKIPSDEDVQKLKTSFLEKKVELIKHLQEIIEQIQGEAPLSGNKRKQLLGNLELITPMFNKFDRESYNYWEALDIRENPNEASPSSRSGYPSLLRQNPPKNPPLLSKLRRILSHFHLLA
jgi:hypothetical protein